MSKQLSLKTIEKENEIYKEKINIPLTVDGQEFVIKLTPFFAPLKIKNAMKMFGEFCQEADKDKVEIKNEDVFDIINCFLIKEFTDIKFGARKAKTILAEFKQLMNNQLYRELMEAFPPASLEEAHGYFNDMNALAAKVENMIKRTQEKVKNLPLDNPEILKGE
ncbi:hypothetical protein WKH56_20855 [Priestia sp. SB1]|uniref:hypothetical protein n=1 Tax=Priestia sp. SB1 TaxID=3132359 RepID=UPI00316D539B